MTPFSGAELAKLGVGDLLPPAGRRKSPVVCDHVISEFIEKNRLTTRSAYYSRAADAGDGVFTFSIPLASGQYTRHARRHLRHAGWRWSCFDPFLSVCLCLLTEQLKTL